MKSFWESVTLNWNGIFCGSISLTAEKSAQIFQLKFFIVKAQDYERQHYEVNNFSSKFCQTKMLVILREFQCTFKFQLFKILFSLLNQLYNSCFHFCNVRPYLLQCLISFRCLDVTRNVLPTKQAQIVHDGVVIHVGIKMPPVPLVNAFVLMAQNSR